jgi:hypothetical protein
MATLYKTDGSDREVPIDPNRRLDQLQELVGGYITVVCDNHQERLVMVGHELNAGFRDMLARNTRAEEIVGQWRSGDSFMVWGDVVVADYCELGGDTEDTQIAEHLTDDLGQDHHDEEAMEAIGEAPMFLVAYTETAQHFVTDLCTRTKALVHAHRVIKERDALARWFDAGPAVGDHWEEHGTFQVVRVVPFRFLKDATHE